MSSASALLQGDTSYKLPHSRARIHHASLSRRDLYILPVTDTGPVTGCPILPLRGSPVLRSLSKAHTRSQHLPGSCQGSRQATLVTSYSLTLPSRTHPWAGILASCLGGGLDSCPMSNEQGKLRLPQVGNCCEA